MKEAAGRTVSKGACERTSLDKGEMNVYDFGEVKLHAYRTNDPISDEVFFFEKAGEVAALEAPCFYDNYAEIERYFSERGLKVSAMLIAYHMCGGTFLPGIRKYSTRNAVEYGMHGGGKALGEQFTAAFGAAFDPKPHEITDLLEEGRTSVCGIVFDVKITNEAFDVEIPEINAVYTHMLGHDCHSIVAGAGHADAMIAQLRGYLAKGYTLVLTSHYTPEDLKDVETKIAYLGKLKEVAADCADAAQFKARVKELYPGYGGENYLDMTAGFFFGA